MSSPKIESARQPPHRLSPRHTGEPPPPPLFSSSPHIAGTTSHNNINEVHGGANSPHHNHTAERHREHLQSVAAHKCMEIIGAERERRLERIEELKNLIEQLEGAIETLTAKLNGSNNNGDGEEGSSVAVSISLGNFNNVWSTNSGGEGATEVESNEGDDAVGTTGHSFDQEAHMFGIRTCDLTVDEEINRVKVAEATPMVPSFESGGAGGDWMASSKSALRLQDPVVTALEKNVAKRHAQERHLERRKSQKDMGILRKELDAKQLEDAKKYLHSYKKELSRLQYLEELRSYQEYVQNVREKQWSKLKADKKVLKGEKSIVDVMKERAAKLELEEKERTEEILRNRYEHNSRFRPGCYAVPRPPPNTSREHSSSHRKDHGDGGAAAIPLHTKLPAIPEEIRSKASMRIREEELRKKKEPSVRLASWRKREKRMAYASEVKPLQHDH